MTIAAGYHAMCGIQNVVRKQDIYYYRRLSRFGDPKPFRLRLSLRTISRRRASLLAPALTLTKQSLAMTMMVNIARRGLTAAQRAEIFGGRCSSSETGSRRCMPTCT